MARSAEGQLTPRQACPRPKRPRAQLAFKNSMVHGILQFTPRIAFRYVLHRCKNRDIHCRESFQDYTVRTTNTQHSCGPNALLDMYALAPMQRRFLFAKSTTPDGYSGPRAVAAKPPRGFRSPCTGLPIRVSTMILPQVHLRKPCYDFSFL